MNWKNNLLVAFAVLTVSSCTNYSKPVISLILGTRATEWDELFYSDVTSACSAHKDVSFKFQDAAKDELEEAEQIKNAVTMGVDAIILNPVSASEILSSAIEKAYDSGVHVIIVGQTLDTYKYDAYVGVDNRRIGQLAASFIASKMGGRGNLMTVSVADFDARFYLERKHAFDNTISNFDGITVTDCPIRVWSSSSAHEAIDSIAALPGTVRPDMIFAYGDDIALGVLEAGIWGEVPVMGVDGTLSTGLAEIQKGNLFATLTNLTRGADVVQAAVDIVKGRPCKKNDIISPGIITAENVNAVIAGMMNIEKLKNKVNAIAGEKDRIYTKLRLVSVIMLILAVLSVILAAGLIIMGIKLRYGRDLFESMKISRAELDGRYQSLKSEYEISEASRRNMEEERKALLDVLSDSRKTMDNQEFSSPVEESAFLSKIKNYIEENLDNAELSMDDIASSLSLSKAQMYRKVRAVSEMTPNELLQAMRLSKADELLKSSDLTIAEVAYAVGFSSPSYFTRCYKEKYGAPPKEKR